jgi:CheY-like chemotaxis protein
MAELPPVLVVDDDPAFRSLMRGGLEFEGYMVADVANGREAVEFLAQHPGSYLITLGLVMPVLDGWGFMQELEMQPAARAQHKIVITSGNTSLLKYRPLAVDAVLPKPFTFDQLLNTIETVCRSWTTQ